MELKDIRTQAPELDPVFESATPALQELLEIPFNLRLVAEMLSSDLSNSELTAIETQVGLLSQYWLHRVVKSASEGTARELVLVDVLRPWFWSDVSPFPNFSCVMQPQPRNSRRFAQTMCLSNKLQIFTVATSLVSRITCCSTMRRLVSFSPQTSTAF